MNERLNAHMNIQEHREWRSRGDEKSLRVDGIYTHPETGRPHISVTNIIDNTIAKPALLIWRSNMALEALTANPDWLKMEQKQARKNVSDYIKSYTDQAKERGSRVHSLVEAYLKGSDVKPLDGDQGYLDALNRWMEKRQARVMDTETTVYHSTGYAGTMDIIAHVNGDSRPTIVDIKSGGVYFEHLVQASAYREAVEEALGVDCVGVEVVGIGQDGTYKTLRATREESLLHYAAFQGAKTIYEVRNHKKLTKLGYFGEEANE